jgi:opacity protein-like surface antigen
LRTSDGLRIAIRFAVAALALLGTARAAETPDAAGGAYDDSRRLYFFVGTGAAFVLDDHFAGDVDLDTADGINVSLGGGVGYNLGRHWGLELQIQGTEPDLRSGTRGKIDELSNITFVPAARLRWPLGDGRWVPYTSAGVGISVTDVNDAAKPYVKASTDSTTVVGSIATGVEYFLTPNVAAGVELRSLIYPDQDASARFAGPGVPVTRSDGTLNLTSISVLAHLRLFLGQSAGPEGRTRHLFLADRGPFDTDARRVYLSGLFGYDFLFDKDLGGGVKLRDEGGDFNLSLGGALGMNVDEHWGAEVQLLVTELNLRKDPFGKFAELSDFAMLPTLRYRWSLCGGRLVPFATAGIGVAFYDVGDRRPVIDVRRGNRIVSESTPRVDVESPSVVASVGAGIEYFLNHHLSVGLLFPFHIYPDVDTRVRETGSPPADGSVNLSGFLAVLQLKVYVP